MKELVNKTLLDELFEKRKDEDRDLIIDKMIKMNWREFLDVLELEEIEREMLELENEKKKFMMLIYFIYLYMTSKTLNDFDIDLIYEVWFDYWIILMIF